MTTLFSRSRGRHRAGRITPHPGWEHHEDELKQLAPPPQEAPTQVLLSADKPLLAVHTTETTQPIPGLPEPTALRDCPIDRCPWPEGVYDKPDLHQVRLVEHIHGHTGTDVIRTFSRMQSDMQELRARP